MSVHDIAELKLAKDELEKRQAQRIGNLGFFDLDLSSENAFWSEEYYNIYGVDPDDFTLNAQAVRKLIYPEG